MLLAEKNEEFYMPEFPDFESLLSYIDHLCKNTDDQERLVIAIDEFPYLAGSYPAISSMLQSHIDQCWKDSNLFLILCGSSMSFMEEQVLGYKVPYMEEERPSLNYILSLILKPDRCFQVLKQKNRQFYTV